MIYIKNTCLDPAYNLAFEEFIFSKWSSDEPVLLLWQNGPSVIIGRYQNALEEVNMDYIREHDVKIVRRNTGGGAVYHDLGNLNYSFIAGSSGDGTDDFALFSAPVIRALKNLGIDAQMSGRNDLLAFGRKFSGCAQQRSKNKVLHHGTLMFDLDLDAASSSLKAKAGKFKSKSVKSVRSRIGNLKPLLIETGLSEDISVTGFRDLLLDQFRQDYEIREHVLSQKELDEVQELSRAKYSQDSWNLGRSPKSDITRGDFFSCGQIEFHFSIEASRIKDVTITGDFFSRSPDDGIGALEKALSGIPYERASILNVLEGFDLYVLFGDIRAEELVDVIV